MPDTSVKNVEGTYEQIPTNEMTLRKPKISSSPQHFKILGMPQRTRGANLSLTLMCASQTCQNNIENWQKHHLNRRRNDELRRPISATLMFQRKEKKNDINRSKTNILLEYSLKLKYDQISNEAIQT